MVFTGSEVCGQIESKIGITQQPRGRGSDRLAISESHITVVSEDRTHLMTTVKLQCEKNTAPHKNYEVCLVLETRGSHGGRTGEGAGAKP